MCYGVRDRLTQNDLRDTRKFVPPSARHDEVGAKLIHYESCDALNLLVYRAGELDAPVVVHAFVRKPQHLDECFSKTLARLGEE